jgi:hypothetical protein
MSVPDISITDISDTDSVKQSTAPVKRQQRTLQPCSSITLEQFPRRYNGVFRSVYVRDLLEMCLFSIRLLDKICEMIYIFSQNKLVGSGVREKWKGVKRKEE